MKKKSHAFARLALPLMLLLPIGCAHVSSADKASSRERQLYQPPTLRLEKGQLYATKDGVHIPQTDEVWHSDTRFRTLEQENLDLAAALSALRKNK